MIDLFKALSDETRLRILAILLQGPLCVCEVQDYLHLTQSNVSRHLNLLRKVGILKSYKNAQWVYYEMDEAFIENNKDLYIYLLKKLKILPSYESDSRRCKRGKGSHVCEISKSIKGVSLNERNEIL
jgi:ArsR family transcriptional regulator